ncbi:hypothetical protein [Solitalea canadensis]|uniref:YD repeat-containing protein n=1 Tax=Solitalea canadensis (strain ATCC 29591 / DSM 3403 / JCM 21819 / LMG 8368 / NBRC 15130 / NCIMB 12057 / USAM 9D) TaxID=929556 RepID=H8KXM3_SOLCM|nr:hypothetical protein [Solitalea canadensis]AFD05319.1 hypothetical protein Solca_0167 [Solitalea canadensis DSM 3403]
MKRKKIMSFSRLLCLLILLYPNLTLKGQDVTGYRPNFLPVSPDASQLFKYIDIPVNLYTGVPNIQVPLYEISENDLKLPIALSYHASGNRVADDATLVGLGWNLNAGGLISRQVRGLPDDSKVGVGFLRYITNHSIVAIQSATGQAKDDLLDPLSYGCQDAEPDLFYINVGNISATFSFDWDGSIKIASKNKIKITYSKETSGNQITAWQVVDEDGTIYQFNTSETSVSQNAQISNFCNYKVEFNSGWLLTKITSPRSGAYITLSYDGYSINQGWHSLESISHKLDGQCSGTIQGMISSSYSDFTVYGLRLKQIKTSSNVTTVNFGVNTATPRTDVTGVNNYSLDSIKVYNGNKLLKEFNPVYDYSAGRLTLRSIKEKNGSLSKNPYLFDYYTGGIGSKLSKAIDYLGYANGATSNQYLFPPSKLTLGTGEELYFTGANRNPDSAATCGGMLKKITYPTRGYDDFEYELNDYIYNASASSNPITRYETMSMVVSCNAAYGTGGITSNWVVTTKNFSIVNHDITQPLKTFPVEINVSGNEFFNGPGGGAYNPYVEIINLATGLAIYHQGISWNNENQSNYNTIKFLTAGNYQIKCAARYKESSGSMRADWASAYVSYEGETENILKAIKCPGLRIKTIKTSDGLNSPIVKRYDYKLTDGSGRSSGAIYAEPVYETTTYQRIQDGQVNFQCSYFTRLGNSWIVTGSTQGSHVGYDAVTVFSGNNGENGKSLYLFDSPHNYPDNIHLEFPYQPPLTQAFKTGLLKKQIDYSLSGTTFIPVKVKANTYDYISQDIQALKVGVKYPGGFSGAAYLDRYAEAYYNSTIGYARIKQEIDTLYDVNGKNPFVSSKKYFYDNPSHAQLTRTIENTSKGDEIVIKRTYPLDYTTSISVPINAMKTQNVVNETIENQVWKKISASDSSLISSSLTKYKQLSNGAIVPDKSYQIENSALIAKESFAPYANNDTFDSKYKLNTSFDLYDNTNANLIQYTNFEGAPVSYKWDYTLQYPIAECVNAQEKDIAFTSFEADGKGGWTFTGVSTTSPTNTVTGKNYYSLAAGAITKTGLTSTIKYVVSYWAKGASITITGGTLGSLFTGRTYNGYTYYERTITGTTSISISGSGQLDDIRIHPDNAQMTTYTFDPLVGITSKTDSKGQVNYFTYDELQRFSLAKDQDGNIIKHFIYHYK